jgi:hypothetical protein
MPTTPSITYWNRLEPDPRSKSLTRSLAAEIRDPLWLLTRQWQLGEFQGENAGSPMSVEIETEAFDLTTFGPAASPKAIQPGPLEPQVQREPYRPDLATRVELAQMWLRLLPANFDFADFRTEYPLPEPEQDELRDPASVRFFEFATGRAFDGFALYDDAVNHPSQIPGSGTQPVSGAITPFKNAVEDVFGTLELSSTPADPPTWRPERLDHQFEVRAKDATREYTMVARPGADGEIDWDAFDLQSSATASGGSAVLDKKTIAPTRLRFSGMPSPRFWDFESATTNLPDVDPDRRDVAKLLMLDLMLVHGVDWFVAHVPVPVGKLVRVKGVVVRNVFGEDTTIGRGEDLTPANRRWTMFRVGGSSGAAGDEFFILPATAAAVRQPGQLLEEVSFGRDETANMAWAIERAVETQLGETWPGTERAAAFDAAQEPPPPLPAVTEPLRYQLGTDVPLHWIPFLPVKISGSTSQIKLVEAEPGGDDRPSPAGRILRPPSIPDGPFSLLEEEVPREGVRVRRLVVRTRWHDGKAYLWVERRRSLGTGETQSGLRFDQALESE